MSEGGSELPGGWVWAELSSLGVWFGGGTPSKSNAKFWANGDVPWLSPKDMGEDVLRGTQNRITNAAVEGSSARLVPEGSVAVVVRSGILERTVPIAFVPFATTLNQDMKAVKPREGIDARWLAYALRSQERVILDTCRRDGTTVASLATHAFQRLRLALPPTREQARIADELDRRLSHVDAAERSLRLAKTKLRLARQAVLEAAVRGTLMPQLLGSRRRDLTLDEASSSIRNGIFVSRPGTEPTGTAILRIGAVRPLELDLSDLRWAALSESDRAKYALTAGDLLFIRYNGNLDLVGACARVRDLRQATVHPDKLIRLIPNPSVAVPGYLELAVNAGPARQAIRSSVKTTAGQAGISGGDLRKVVVALPDLATQKLIVEEVERRLSKLKAAEVVIDEQARKTVKTRQALLREAFNGRLVPQDPSDEPAGVLIERISAARDTTAVKKPRAHRARPNSKETKK